MFGPTCDALDTISQAEALPELKLGDLVYSENIGAYSQWNDALLSPQFVIRHSNQPFFFSKSFMKERSTSTDSGVMAL